MGFWIDLDIQKSLLERLVIDPIFFYVVMVLLVPLSFGFTYMMIKLAKNAEAKAKPAKERYRQRSDQPSSKMGIYNLHWLAHLPNIP